MAAQLLLEVDPEAAHAHAEVAAYLAARTAVCREAVGVTAYATGRWAQALSELRAARRLSGSDSYLAVMADCERGLGRPEKALELAASPQARHLGEAERVELAIVVSGARRDMGQPDAAVAALRNCPLTDDRAEYAGRLRYAYADALLAAGRRDDAREWFHRALAVDSDGETDAAERLDELDGVTFDNFDDTDDEPDDDTEVADQPAGVHDGSGTEQRGDDEVDA